MPSLFKSGIAAAVLCSAAWVQAATVADKPPAVLPQQGEPAPSITRF